MRTFFACCLLLSLGWTTVSAEEPTHAPAAHDVVSFGLQLPLNTPQVSYYARIPDGMDVQTAWIAEDCGEVCPANTRIATIKLTGDGTVAHFQLSKPTNGWPTGIYRIDVRHNGRVLASQRFMIGDVMIKRQSEN